MPFCMLIKKSDATHAAATFRRFFGDASNTVELEITRLRGHVPAEEKIYKPCTFFGFRAGGAWTGPRLPIRRRGEHIWRQRRDRRVPPIAGANLRARATS